MGNIMAALAYLFGWISGIIVYFIAGEDKVAKFHGVQSILFNIAYFVVMVAVMIVMMVVGVVLGIVGGMLKLGGLVGLLMLIPWLIVLLCILAIFCLAVFTMYKAYTGEKYKMPFIGNFAEKFSQ